MQKTTFDIEGSQPRRPAPRKRSTACAKHRRRPARPAVPGIPAVLRAARPSAPHEVPGGDAMSARILPRCRTGEVAATGTASDASRAPAQAVEPAWCWQRPNRRRRGGCGRWESRWGEGARRHEQSLSAARRL